MTELLFYRSLDYDSATTDVEREQRIVRDLMSEPYVEGRRIGVLGIYERVEGRDLRPETVADRYDLDRADVYRALAYYHEHLREMQRVRAERERAYEGLLDEIDRPSHVDPDDRTDDDRAVKSPSQSRPER